MAFFNIEGILTLNEPSISSIYTIANEINIVIKKVKIQNQRKQENSNKQINEYAKDIIKKWNINQEIYEIKYYLFISTTQKNITGTLESLKTKATTEQQDSPEDEVTLKNLEKLNEIFNDVKSYLSIYQPRQMNADEIINFYATYANANETNLKYTNELLTDCYISSCVEFKKDYIQFELNNGK